MPERESHDLAELADLHSLAPTSTAAPIDMVARDGGTPLLGKKARRGKLGVIGWISLGWLVLITLAAILAPILPIPSPDEQTASLARQPPLTNGHLLGGDALGRDLLSRIIWGGRASLLLGVSSVFLGIVIGGTLGLMAGYFRGRTDSVLTGIFDILLSFPALVLALTLVTAFATGDNISSSRRMLVLILALGVVSVPVLARITRGSTLSWAEREFVMAARALGARNREIMFREVLPNVLPAMFSIALLGVAVVIVAEGGLSVLGVGVMLPTPSWGNIIAEGRADLPDAPHIVLWPTIVIFLTVFALNYLGDIVRTKFDVRESAL